MSLNTKCARGALLDDLFAIANEATPLKGRGFIIAQRSGRNSGRAWLSGVPYVWTMYADHAFVFPDRATAARFIMRHDLTECEIVGG